MPEIDGDFLDPRNSMNYWYPKVSELDVHTPETRFFDISDVDSSFDMMDGEVDMKKVLETIKNIPTEEILKLVEELPTEKAQIRTDWKSSTLAGGNMILPNKKTIEEQIIHLVDSMVMSGFPINSLVVREWIEVAELAEAYGSTICPEVRFIVDEGEVIDGFVDIYESDFDTSFTQAEVTQVLSEITQKFEEDYELLSGQAGKVASRMDDTGWSVDFIQDSSSEWYLTDMALYGLYWNEKEEEWYNISHIPEGKEYNLAENLPPSLTE